MRAPRLRLLLALLAAFSLILAACSSDDDGDSADAPTDADADDSGDEGAGGATFEFTPLDVGGPLTKDALTAGDIDIALLFTSDGAIAANDWVLLEDDQALQPVDNFVPAIRDDVVTEDIAAVLDAASAALTTEAIQGAVAAVAIDGENPDDVAAAFLEENGLPGDLTAEGDVTVGAADFAESEITAEVYAGALEGAGVAVERSLGLGAREVYFPALEAGEIDLIPEFVGTLLTFLEGTATSDLESTLTDLRAAAGERGVAIGEAAPGDSKNGLVVTSETADMYGLTTTSDLASVSDPLVLGGPPECPEREFCLIGLQEVYGLTFG